MPDARNFRFPSFAGTCLDGLLTACAAVDERREPHSTTPRRTLDHLVIIHTRSGAGAWHLDDRILRLNPGTLTAIAPNVPHHQVVGNAWWHCGYLMLQGPWLTELHQALTTRGGALAMGDDDDLRQDLDRAIAAALYGQETWAWRFAAAVTHLIDRLLHRTLVTNLNAPLEERLRRLIDDAPALRWAVTDLATALGLSGSTLAHRATAELGCSPARWVRRRKAHLARLLLTSGVTISDASARLGFANPYHFSRVVREELGKPPSSFAATPVRR